MLSAVAAQSEVAEQPPSAELLLYLGEFEDANGDFVDPMAIDAAATKPTADPPSATPRDVEDKDEDEDDDEPAPHSA